MVLPLGPPTRQGLWNRRKCLEIFTVLLVLLKHECVCLWISVKSLVQHKLKSAIVEIFADMTPIKARLVILEHPVKRHCWHKRQWSTWWCLWASVRGQGDNAPCMGEQKFSLPFIILALEQRSASSLYSQPLAWGLVCAGFSGFLG